MICVWPVNLSQISALPPTCFPQQCCSIYLAIRVGTSEASMSTVCLVAIEDLRNLSVSWELIDLGCQVRARFSFGANGVPIVPSC